MEIEKLVIGKRYEIHGYKHDGNIHRIWDEAVLTEIHDDYLVFGNERTKVTESDGRVWKTKEPAVLFFYYNKFLLFFLEKSYQKLIRYSLFQIVLQDNNINKIKFL